ncbi:MAG TPA: leishmanolysin-related zinc metalloendopeptidase [Gemmatimonadaceae bacterium]
MRFIRSVAAAFRAGSAILLLTSCGGDATGSHPVPASVAAASEAQFSGTAGSVLTPSPTFVVRDAQGNSLGGVPVTVTVTSGSAKVTNSPTQTASAGPTSVGTVTFGQQSGPSVITVTVSGLPALSITVTSSADVPAMISVDQGFVASGLAGSSMPIPIAVRDKFGNGIPNVPVTFTVTGGGGTVTPATITSVAEGRLPGVLWTFGKSAVPQTLSVSGANITSAVNGTVLSSYPIDLRFFGPPLSPEALASFNDAAARVRGIVVAPQTLINFPPTTNANACGGPDITSIGSTTGIIIYASVDSIDGPSHVLAQSGPCFVRNSNSLPVLGIMKFDRDDLAALVANGRLASVVLHEMLHTIGFGTVWGVKGLLTGTGTDDPEFTGSGALSACGEAAGSTWCVAGVPVENCLGIDGCGAGNRDSHWRESIFDAELMTGFIEGAGKAMPLSNISVQSLADLGYSTNNLAADPYTVPLPSIAMSPQLNVGAFGAATPVWEKTQTPMFKISSDRTVTRIRR